MHIRYPVTLSVGECITFTARPSYRVVGNWTWRKDTIALPTSSRVVTNKNNLWISDVEVEDSAYYSAEVETVERNELFQFWLNVEGILNNRWFAFKSVVVKNVVITLDLILTVRD